MNKHQQWHDAIIARARSRRLNSVYVERHHIVPKSLGGSNDPSNLVDLTYREHFLVHWLLIRLTTGHARHLMMFAFHCMTMSLGGRPPIAAWQYDMARRYFFEMRRENRRKRIAKRALLGHRRRKQIAETAAAAMKIARAPKGALTDAGRKILLADRAAKAEAESIRQSDARLEKQAKPKKKRRLSSRERKFLRNEKGRVRKRKLIYAMHYAGA